MSPTGPDEAAIQIPTNDDTIAGPVKHFSLTVDQADAIPYRFVPGGHLVTVLDNDQARASVRQDAPRRGQAPRCGGRARRQAPGSGRASRLHRRPTTSMARLPAVCVPGSMSVMPAGHTRVTCSATDKAGQHGQQLVRRDGAPVGLRRRRSGGRWPWRLRDVQRRVRS